MLEFLQMLFVPAQGVMGAIVDPVTAAILVGSAAAPAIGQALSGRKAKKAEKNILAGDVADLKAGKLGLSGAEKRDLAAAAQQAAAQQAAALQAGVARQSMSTGGLPGALSGRAAALQTQIAKGAGAQAASATAQATQLSKQLSESRRQAILARLGQHTAKKNQAGLQQGQAIGNAIRGGGAVLGNEEMTKALKLYGDTVA